MFYLPLATGPGFIKKFWDLDGAHEVFTLLNIVFPWLLSKMAASPVIMLPSSLLLLAPPSVVFSLLLRLVADLLSYPPNYPRLDADKLCTTSFALDEMTWLFSLLGTMNMPFGLNELKRGCKSARVGYAAGSSSNSLFFFLVNWFSTVVHLLSCFDFIPGPSFSAVSEGG